MLTCLQKHEYDNFGCEKEVGDFYACINEFQVLNKDNISIEKKDLIMYLIGNKCGRQSKSQR
jgi:hypothetical protein